MTTPTNICYFSGTGNTKLVARLLESELKKLSIPVTTTAIEDGIKGNTPLPDTHVGMLGIGYPVHGFGPPRLIFDFVRRLPLVHGTKAFVFMTAGDAFFLNNAAGSVLARFLEKKGYEVFHESLIPMPANIAIPYPDGLMRLLCAKAEREARRLAHDISEGRVHRFGESGVAKLVARGLNMIEHSGTCFFGKDLAVSKECRLCNACVRECPVQNITRVGDKIRFGWKCMACFRCIYRCPHRAILPRLERFAVLKGGYDIEKVFEGRHAETDFLAQKTGWMYKRLKQYLLAE
jgi:ferredoxin/flavodoxin